MNRQIDTNDSILHLVLLLLCLVPLSASFILATDASAVYFRFDIPEYLNILQLPCVFKAATGYDCPACGMTRCFIFMNRLDIADAYSMNKAGVLLWFFCIFQVAYRSLLLIRARIPLKKLVQPFQAVCLVAFGIFLFYDFIIQFI